MEAAVAWKEYHTEEMTVRHLSIYAHRNAK
jgi:hypothetical protein